MQPGETAISFVNPTTQCKLVGRVRDVRSDSVVIFAHGFASHKDGFHFPELAVAFGQRNVSSLRFGKWVSRVEQMWHPALEAIVQDQTTVCADTTVAYDTRHGY